MINNKFNPYIMLFPYPINCNEEDMEDNDNSFPLYHVLVSQGKLKMLFLVVHQNYNSKRQFETIKCEYVSLHGLNERDEYLQQTDKIGISADCSIVNKIFEYSLSPYGIRLISTNFHNFEFFESDKEGTDFVFEKPEVYEELKDRINKTCIKMLSIPKVNQY